MRLVPDQPHRENVGQCHGSDLRVLRDQEA